MKTPSKSQKQTNAVSENASSQLNDESQDSKSENNDNDQDDQDHDNGETESKNDKSSENKVDDGVWAIKDGKQRRFSKTVWENMPKSKHGYILMPDTPSELLP
jgi:hypothetical protein